MWQPDGSGKKWGKNVTSITCLGHKAMDDVLFLFVFIFSVSLSPYVNRKESSMTAG
jgi:hypothetical protein